MYLPLAGNPVATKNRLPVEFALHDPFESRLRE